MKNPPDRATLKAMVDILEDPVEDLVRKDSVFKKLELDASDYTTKKAVVDLLVEHPKLLQRPVVVTKDKAIIGRPKDRITELLS
jgi:arsenate reductase